MFLSMEKVEGWVGRMSSNVKVPSGRMIAMYRFVDVKVGEDLVAQELESGIRIMSESRRIDRIVSNGMELLIDGR